MNTGENKKMHFKCDTRSSLNTYTLTERALIFSIFSVLILILIYNVKYTNGEAKGLLVDRQRFHKTWRQPEPVRWHP